jgi:hypothetical protein
MLFTKLYKVEFRWSRISRLISEGSIIIPNSMGSRKRRASISHLLSQNGPEILSLSPEMGKMTHVRGRLAQVDD